MRWRTEVVELVGYEPLLEAQKPNNKCHRGKRNDEVAGPARRIGLDLAEEPLRSYASTAGIRRAMFVRVSRRLTVRGVLGHQKPPARSSLAQRWSVSKT